MDKRMPVMDGIETTQRIRALPGGRDVKIAAVTASAFTKQRDELLASGMDDFVRKPYRPAEIFDCMTRQLGVHFIHAEQRHPETVAAISLNSLVHLPESLRSELSESLVLGNTDLLGKLLIRIAQHDSELGKILEQHVSAFNYLPILNALDATYNKETKL
jgi:CheY-like chemotaxis protein